jgi:ABC-type maltose transport system permease subunit
LRYLRGWLPSIMQLDNCLSLSREIVSVVRRFTIYSKSFELACKAIIIVLNSLKMSISASGFFSILSSSLIPFPLRFWFFSSASSRVLSNTFMHIVRNFVIVSGLVMILSISKRLSPEKKTLQL